MKSPLNHARYLIAPIALLAFATCASAADPQPGDKAYYCDFPNGSRNWTTTPCPPGTELRTGHVVDPKEVFDTTPPDTSARAASPKNLQQDDADEDPVAAAKRDRYKYGTLTVETWLHSLPRLLAFAFIVGIVAKLAGRPFFRWSLVGIFFYYVLAAAHVPFIQ